MALNVLNTRLAVVLDYLKTLPSTRLRTAVELAESVPNKVVEKYDALLTESLLNEGYASAHFAIPDTAATIKEISNSL